MIGAVAASAAQTELGTVPRMDNAHASETALLRELHRTAEQCIDEALIAVRDAQVMAETVDPQFASGFEYHEAVRNLRAALTAVRSADLEWRQDQ